MASRKRTLACIRVCLSLFFVGLVFGLHTVVFVRAETTWMADRFGRGTFVEERWPTVAAWFEHLHIAFATTYTTYPVIAYCMDWLGYACIVLAVLMVGAIKDPVRNIWIVQAFMVGCTIAFVMPLVMGPLRGIPLFWRLIDSSFGLVGFFLLLLPYRLIRGLEASSADPGHG